MLCLRWTHRVHESCYRLFVSFEQAQHMDTLILQAVRDQWGGDPPITTITAVAQELTKRVCAHHYDRSESPPDRVSWDYEEKSRRSAKTTVLDDEVIEKESVVDRMRNTLTFEKCHIDASLKNSKDDTTGNHIPLPSDWHDFFDAYTCDRIASVSIAPAGVDCIGELGKDGRYPVLVHVYFDPSNPKAPKLHDELRCSTMVRPNVFSVTVCKKEPQKFVELLAKRHNAVLQKWSRVP